MRDRPTLAPMARSMAAPKARGWGAHQRASCPVRKADNVAYVARKFSLSGTQKGVKPIDGSHVTDRTRWVTTGHNRDDGRSLFCRFLAAAPTHRYAFRLTCSQRVRSLRSIFLWNAAFASIRAHLIVDPDVLQLVVRLGQFNVTSRSAANNMRGAREPPTPTLRLPATARYCSDRLCALGAYAAASI
jgi:hypothetical protein